MAEYIDRGRLLQDIENHYLSDGLFQRWVKMQPTVDAVPVVRCKDCKHLMFSDCYGECGAGHLGIVRPDDFCSRVVERMTNNEL